MALGFSKDSQWDVACLQVFSTVIAELRDHHSSKDDFILAIMATTNVFRWNETLSVKSVCG